MKKKPRWPRKMPFLKNVEHTTSNVKLHSNFKHPTVAFKLCQTLHGLNVNVLNLFYLRKLSKLEELKRIKLKLSAIRLLLWINMMSDPHVWSNGMKFNKRNEPDQRDISDESWPWWMWLIHDGYQVNDWIMLLEELINTSIIIASGSGVAKGEIYPPPSLFITHTI